MRLPIIVVLLALALLLTAACSQLNETGVATVDQKQHDRRVDYVEFASTDLEATKAFYSAVFGWRFTDWGPDYVSFEDGRLTGGFTTAESVETGGGALVVIYAVDLESILAAVREQGGTIVREPFTFPGGRRFHFKDPAGNELAVWSDHAR